MKEIAMYFPRSLICPFFILSLLLISGCDTEEKNCIAEEAEDYELNEIFFNLSAVPDEYSDAFIKVKFAMYALDDLENKIPLQSKKKSRIDIRANGKACDLISEEFCWSDGNHRNAYTCDFDVGGNQIPEDMIITASYQRGDTIAEASIRGLGTVSDIQLQESVNPGDEKWVFSLKNDMTISWKLPKIGLPDDAIQVQIVRERIGEEKQILFEETLRGDAAGITIPRNTFEHFASSPLKLYVTTITNGTIPPLAAGGSAQAERTIEKAILALACGADEIEFAAPGTEDWAPVDAYSYGDPVLHTKWRCKTKAAADIDNR